MKKPVIAAVFFIVISSSVYAQHGPVRIIDFQVSSQMPDYPPWSYGALMAFDGDPLTSWVEGADGDGTGEYLELELDREITVDAFGVMPGFFDARYFFTNNRVKHLKAHIGAGYLNLRFQDKMVKQIINLDGPVSFTAIRFEIAEVYPGRDPDTCIADIAFYTDGTKIDLQLPLKPQRIYQTKYYRVPVYGSGQKNEISVIRDEYAIVPYAIPDIILYREAVNLNALREISAYKFEQMKEPDYDMESLWLKVEPNSLGYIGSITTAFNYRASTGIVTTTYSFGEEGLLKEMRVDAMTSSHEPVQITRLRDGVLKIVEKMEYWQGGAGEAVTSTTLIEYNSRYEIIDYTTENESEYLYEERAY